MGTSACTMSRLPLRSTVALYDKGGPSVALICGLLLWSKAHNAPVALSGRRDRRTEGHAWALRMRRAELGLARGILYANTTERASVRKDGYVRVSFSSACCEIRATAISAFPVFLLDPSDSFHQPLHSILFASGSMPAASRQLPRHPGAKQPYANPEPSSDTAPVPHLPSAGPPASAMSLSDIKPDIKPEPETNAKKTHAKGERKPRT